jgi:uncharacterized protein
MQWPMDANQMPTDRQRLPAMIDALGRFVRSLPVSVEFAIVILAAFGSATWAAIEWLRSGQAGSVEAMTMRPGDGVSLVVLEVGTALALALLLVVRGWTFERLDIRPSWRGLAVGIGIAVFIYALDQVIDLLLHSAVSAGWLPTVFDPEREPKAADGMGLVRIGLAEIVLMSVVNGVFEEVFVCGYVMRALSPHTGLLWAAAASCAIRFSYHLYQGAVAWTFHAVFAVVFVSIYVITRQLWPLMTAHVLLDVAALVEGRSP